MAHVTFVHGIGNKPPPEDLLRQWRTALLVDDGLDLDDLEGTSSMVYWADLLYDRPASVAAGNESTELELNQLFDAHDADMGWLNDAPAVERELVEGLAQSLGLADVDGVGGESYPVMADSALEAVPLPGPIKKRLMRVLLRDVHHFLFDTEFSPRAGTSLHVRTEIRRRMVDALQEGDDHPGPHVLVGHSLGSVIAYDALAAVDGVPRVDALVTLGSPLGITEIQEGLTPPWTRHDGWPSAGLGPGGWFNFYDPLDPVCGGLGRLLAPDFRRAGAKHVADVHVTNKGAWRHSANKYLGQGVVRDWLRNAMTSHAP